MYVWALGYISGCSSLKTIILITKQYEMNISYDISHSSCGNNFIFDQVCTNF